MSKKVKGAEQIPFRERSHSFKMRIVTEIENGQISRNYASKKYLTTRSTIDYWVKKVGCGMETNENRLQKQLKKLRDENEELRQTLDLKSDIMEALIKEIGEERVKKLYPKQLIEEIRQMTKRLL